MSGSGSIGAGGIPPDLADQVLDGLPQGVIVTDEHGVILRVNRAFSEITGHAAADVLGQTTKILRTELPAEGFFRAMFERLAADGGWSGTLWSRGKDGRAFPAQLDVRRLAPGAPLGARYVATLSDMARHHDHAAGNEQSLCDPLTGLSNRILLKDRAQQEIARAQRTGKVIGFVFVDLDGFKPINDTLGHEAGDLVLREVAARLKATLRGNDTLARFGGDEFVALMPDIADRASTLALTSKLLGAFRDPIEVDGQACDLGASIGISLYPDDGSTFDELVARADMAMYRAKGAGGNSVQFYDESMTRSAGDLLLFRTRLHSAMGKGEFHVLFQPQVHLGSGRLSGAEALLRWRDPERGLLAAAEFIPLAEKTGLIVQLGNWVLQEACHVLRHIRDAGHADFCMSVNISPLQLIRGDDFIGDVGTALAASGAPADGLRLEITDAVFLRDPVRMGLVLKQLTRRGVSLALDNFGSGYSSLGYLKDMPFDTIKIDRQYTCDAHQDRYSGSVARAAINLAGGLDIKVVAEGVENCQQLAFLTDIGCHFGQGNLFGRPVDETRLKEQLAGYAMPCPTAA